VTEQELGLPIGKQVQYGGQWWRCGGMVSTPAPAGMQRERQYFLTRGGDVARVPADCITAVREARKP
jgi:hypothetical protein